MTALSLIPCTELDRIKRFRDIVGANFLLIHPSGNTLTPRFSSWSSRVSRSLPKVPSLLSSPTERELVEVPYTSSKHPACVESQEKSGCYTEFSSQAACLSPDRTDGGGILVSRNWDTLADHMFTVGSPGAGISSFHK